MAPELGGHFFAARRGDVPCGAACLPAKPKRCGWGHPAVSQKASGCIGGRKVPTRGANGKSADRNRLFPATVIRMRFVIAFSGVRIHSEKYAKKRRNPVRTRRIGFPVLSFFVDMMGSVVIKDMHVLTRARGNALHNFEGRVLSAGTARWEI